MHPAAGPTNHARTVRLTYEVSPREDEWVLPETDVPESNPHREAVELLRLILLAFVARTGRDALVAANLACRWDEHNPKVGVDPDIALIEPAPPEGAQASSLLTWLPGHVPPRFAIEVVSASNPTKDYEEAPAKYALLGTRELVVFDPWKQGPRSQGGPHVLQVWRRVSTESEPGGAADGEMVRVHAGDGPAYSEELGAWLVVEGNERLRISDDAEASSLWPTPEEARLRTAIEDLCEAYGQPLDEPRRAQLASLDVAALESLRAAVKARRGWPG